MTGPRPSLPRLVRSRYATARSSGVVVFADSQLVEILVGGLSLQLRYCPSLAKKPGSKTPRDGPPAKKFDPFEDPSEDLLIEIASPDRPAHILVLNKFPIIPNHFILATKANKEQTHLLQADDLYETYQCLRAWHSDQTSDQGDERLFGFFNSGEHSGASQPHRHVQFLPVEDMRGDGGASWQLLVDGISATSSRGGQGGFIQLPNLGFVHFGLPVSEDCSKADLFTIYKRLYAAAAAAVRRFVKTNPSELSLCDFEGGSLPISYNLGMTKDTMVICPRRSEGSMVHCADHEAYVALNGTLLGGTLMVKDEDAYNVLQRTPDRLAKVLEAVGIPAGQGYDDLEEDELELERYPELREVPRSGSL